MPWIWVSSAPGCAVLREEGQATVDATRSIIGDLGEEASPANGASANEKAPKRLHESIRTYSLILQNSP